MTKLTKRVDRETNRTYQRRAIIVTIAPAGSQDEALIGFRLKGTQTQYVCAVSSLFQMAAMWHGNKEKSAKKKARRDGVPWPVARRQFKKENSI